MYQIVTYKSKPLKVKTIPLGEEVSPGFSEKEELTYMIDGVEVREEDLTLDERLDIEAESVLNKDGFYTPLLPIDSYEQEEVEERKENSALKIILIIGGTIVLLVGIAVAMITIL